MVCFINTVITQIYASSCQIISNYQCKIDQGVSISVSTVNQQKVTNLILQLIVTYKDFGLLLNKFPFVSATRNQSTN